MSPTSFFLTNNKKAIKAYQAALFKPHSTPPRFLAVPLSEIELISWSLTWDQVSRSLPLGPTPSRECKFLIKLSIRQHEPFCHCSTTDIWNCFSLL